MLQVDDDTRVSFLIDQDRFAWKVSLVKELFLPHDADMILGIPLSFKRPPDYIAWAPTPSGIFTTNSAYKLIVSGAMNSFVGSSNLDNQRKFWRGLWQLRVPNKIKMFVWKACNDALPTMDNLYRQHIAHSDRCNLCQKHPEDVVHVLWPCKDILSAWLSLEWFHQAVPVQPVCIRELLSRFMHCQDEYRVEIFVITAWSIWNRRNALHFGRSALPMDQICNNAGNFLQEFLASQDKESTLPSPPSVQRWCPPTLDVCKVNFDAAIFRSSNLASLGVVVRDNRGVVIGALSVPISLGSSVAKLKALACLRAIQFASEISLT